MTPATPLGRSLLSLPPAVRRPTGHSVVRTARANKVLVTLWLMSASAFRRLGRMDDAMKAIEEAERVDASNPEVWYQVMTDNRYHYRFRASVFFLYVCS